MSMHIDTYFMRLADVIAERSTCLRAHVGAIIAKDGFIISTGYNGSPSGMPHCEDVGCQLDERGHCVATVHAEINAILQAARNGASTNGATLYCTHHPCLSCTKAILNSGIVRIVFKNKYDAGTLAQSFLNHSKISIEQYKLGA